MAMQESSFSVVLILAPQVHMEVTVSLRCEKSFIPPESWAANEEFSCFIFIINLLNAWFDSEFLFSGLRYSIYQYNNWGFLF